MPSKYSLFKSNRSQASLLNPHDSKSQQTSPTGTPLQSPAFPPAALDFAPDHGDEVNHHFPHQQQQQHDPYRTDAARYYQSGFPTRSQSQRIPSSSYGQPTIQLVRPAQSGAEPQSFDEEDPHNFYNVQPTQNWKPEQEHRRSKRSFFGLHSSAKDPQTQSSAAGHSSSKSLGRNLSVRRRTPAHLDRQDQHYSQPEPPRLTSSGEEDDGGARLDRFLQETAKPITSTTATGPPRSPIFPPSPPHLESQMRAPLPRVNTDSSSRPAFQRRDDHDSPQREAGAAQPPQYSRESSQPTSQPQFQAYQSPPPQAPANTYQPLQSQRSSDSKFHHPFQPQDPQRIRPPSQQSYEPPSPSAGYKAYDPQSESQSQSHLSRVSQQYLASSMALPGPPQQTRRSSELGLATTQGASQQAGGNMQAYGQTSSQNSQGQAGTYPAGQGQQGGGYMSRGPSQSQAGVSRETLGEQGRSTPPPGKSRDDAAGMDLAQLLARHDELRE